MAAVDAHYRYQLFDVGAPGRFSDGGIWRRSGFANYVETTLPQETTILPKSKITANHYVVGDAAFGLSWCLLSPFAGQTQDKLSTEKLIFNYRLSRARRIVENVFGITANRWRLLRRCMEFQPEMAVVVTKAIGVLHNFCMEHVSTYDCDSKEPGTVSEDAGIGTLQLANCDRTSNRAGFNLRDRMCRYFSSEGALSWQENMINKKY